MLFEIHRVSADKYEEEITVCLKKYRARGRYLIPKSSCLRRLKVLPFGQRQCSKINEVETEEI